MYEYNFNNLILSPIIQLFKILKVNNKCEISGSAVLWLRHLLFCYVTQASGQYIRAISKGQTVKNECQAQVDALLSIESCDVLMVFRKSKGANQVGDATRICSGVSPSSCISSFLSLSWYTAMSLATLLSLTSNHCPHIHYIKTHLPLGILLGGIDP
jgi:hypothetical protein